jgi:hypothetical protein
MLKNLRLSLSQLFDIEVLYAPMVGELPSNVLILADLAHYMHLWTLFLNVLEQLSSSHVLELLSVANVATELRTAELGMSL